MANLDKYSYHEAVDRSHVANDHFHEYVETHPVVQVHPELKEAAERVTSQMYAFYNLCSAFSDNRENPESTN